MASNTTGYLKINGPNIEGEAKDSAHQKWLDVESVSLAVARGGQREAVGLPSWGDLQLTRVSDKASPKLAIACASGKVFDEMEINLVAQHNNKTQNVVKYKLKKARVTSHTSTAAEAGKNPREGVTLTYNQIEIEQWPFDDKGNPGPSTKVSYNLGTNEATGL